MTGAKNRGGVRTRQRVRRIGRKPIRTRSAPQGRGPGWPESIPPSPPLIEARRSNRPSGFFMAGAKNRGGVRTLARISRRAGGRHYPCYGAMVPCSCLVGSAPRTPVLAPPTYCAPGLPLRACACSSSGHSWAMAFSPERRPDAQLRRQRHNARRDMRAGVRRIGRKPIRTRGAPKGWSYPVLVDTVSPSYPSSDTSSQILGCPLKWGNSRPRPASPINTASRPGAGSARCRRVVVRRAGRRRGRRLGRRGCGRRFRGMRPGRRCG